MTCKPASSAARQISKCELFGVAALGGHTQAHAKRPPARSVDVKGAGHQRHQAIALGGIAVGVPDLAAFAAAHHGPAQGSLQQSAFNEHVEPSCKKQS
jgi:hypothetical protein